MHRMVKSRRPTPPARPHLEVLEDRTVPSVAHFVPGDLIVKFRADVGRATGPSPSPVPGPPAPSTSRRTPCAVPATTAWNCSMGCPTWPPRPPRLRGLPGVEYAEPNWIYTTRRRPTTPTTPTARCGACTATTADPSARPGPPTSTAARRRRRGRRLHRLQHGLRRHHRRGHRVQPPRPRRQHLDQPLRPGRRHRQRRQRLRRRHPRLGLRQQRQHDLRRHRATTTARTSPAPSAPWAATASASPASTGTSRSSPASSSARAAARPPTPSRRSTTSTDLKIRHGLNIVATNNSWGGGGFSQALLDAITRAANAGHPVHRRGRQRQRRSATTTTRPPATRPNYNTTAGAGYDSSSPWPRSTAAAAWPPSPTTAPRRVDLGAPGVGIWSTTAERHLRLATAAPRWRRRT